MNDYLVVTDTTSAMDASLAKKYNITLISLSVLLHGKEYKDQVDMTTDELYAKLDAGDVPTTSQPNQGYIQEEMKKWKEKNYKAIVIVTCSSDLSGTWNAFNLAKNTLHMDNIYIIDTRQIGAPVMDIAIYVKHCLDRGEEVENVLDKIQPKIVNAFSFLYPDNFTQLKKGGRLSPAAANIATLLKMRALLYLKEDGSCVEKYMITRTEKKILSTIIDKFKELKVQSDTHKIYVLQANNMVLATRVKEILQDVFNKIDCDIVKLPAVLTCHGGMGCIAIQSTVKLD
ncbi:MAG: DegV family protein [Coprobacillaceae bacterium]